MAVYKKESLEKLLKLIDEICIDDENLWFKEYLIDNFENNKNQNKLIDSNLLELTNDLRRTSYYLRNIDKKIWTEGLNFHQNILNSILKISLIKDFRYMKIADYEDDLVEYVRRIVLQLENCFNFVILSIDAHSIISNNPNNFKNEYNDLFEGKYGFFEKGRKRQLKHIPITSKVFFVKSFYNLNYDYKALNEMIKLRNLSSHGGALSKNSIEKEIGKDFIISEKKANYLKCYLSFYKKMKDLYY